VTAKCGSPELRKALFFPRCRIGHVRYAVVMEAYVVGVSTRAVDDLVAGLASTRASPSPRSCVSAGGLDERVTSFLIRRLNRPGVPYV
jgi:putative transposase